jgi:hypothetical protein
MKNSTKTVDLDKMRIFFEIKKEKFTSIRSITKVNYKIKAINDFMKDRTKPLSDGWSYSSFNSLFNFKSFDVFYKRTAAGIQLWVLASKETGNLYWMSKAK